MALTTEYENGNGYLLSENEANREFISIVRWHYWRIFCFIFKIVAVVVSLANHGKVAATSVVTYLNATAAGDQTRRPAYMLSALTHVFPEGHVPDFLSSVIAYFALLALLVALRIGYMSYLAVNLKRKSNGLLFVFPSLMAVIEMAAICCHVTSILALGDTITFLRYRWELILHVTFLVNVYAIIMLDSITFVMKGRKLRYSVPLIPVGVIIAAVYTASFYAPVSWSLIGIKPWYLITPEDFGSIRMGVEAKDILTMLMNIGHVAQYVYALLILAMLFAIISGIRHCYYRRLYRAARRETGFEM